MGEAGEQCINKDANATARNILTDFLVIIYLICTRLKICGRAVAIL